MRESRTFGSVRGGDGNIPTYSDGLLDFAFGSPCLVVGLLPTANPRTKFRSVSLKDLTTRSESSNDVPTDCETRNTSA